MTIDIDALVNTEVTEKLDTKFSVPPAAEYVATISDKGPVSDWFKTVQTKNGEQAQCNVLFIINDPEVAKALGRQQATTRLTIWLDTEVDAMTGKSRISTGKGKNVSLGQLREALGQDNDPNWNFSKLLGAGPIKVLTENSIGRNGGEFSNVVRVAKI